MQHLHFDSVEDFLDYLPEPQLEIVSRLRQLVFDCIPNVQEKLAYNVPFYSRNKRICYIWPAAVPWGKVPLEGVSLGFAQGHRLNDELGFLERGTRKQVYTKTMHHLQELDDGLLRMYLFQAAELDAMDALT
ncbi:MAG: DUF1801 domain-containing protein [Salibacteraceae bacterium]